MKNEKFEIKFDEIILKQLKQLEKDKETKERISKMLDKIEENGPNAGKILDSNLSLYEVKTKKPPIRLYYQIEEKKAYVFEYEIKTSKKKQQNTIKKIKKKSKT
tara:strand:- start:761 stop:1072 length:312 start_codon:yes stop_codon:yes gene_type:complete